MATRALIAKDLGNDQVKYIYSHWDGYPSHVGRILFGHYNTEEKLDALLEQGDVSILAEEIGEKHPFGEDVKGACTFYGRDRGEKGVEAKVIVAVDEKTIRERADECGAEYVYLFRNNEWQYLKVYGNGSFAPLTEEVVEKSN